MKTYIPCMCCDKDAEYRHWFEDTEQYDWFCIDDKCGDCEFMGWTRM